jgi:protein involved in polysaccharide export with SLBB domain
VTTKLAKVIFLAGSLAAVLSGCSAGDDAIVATPEQEAALIKAAATTSPNLQPGEKIKVTVFGEDRLSGEYQIDPAGDVSLPLAGTLKAAGLTQVQMEHALTAKFKSEYLRDPKVTVEVSSFRPFYILGEVAKPGEYPFSGSLNIMSAMALAGGATYRANQSVVLIQHAGDASFTEYPLSPSIPILPGDVVRIPVRYF